MKRNSKYSGSHREKAVGASLCETDAEARLGAVN